VVDADPEAAAKAAAEVGCDTVEASLEEALQADIDGVVIATPSALHADQSLVALDRGLPVFCQKPLGRTEAETARVVEAARERDLLLGVDLSYRYADAFMKARDVVRSGELGKVYAADLVFHNAYGPDKAWFTDAVVSGGGCVIDLGTHLVDLALWTLGGDVREVTSQLFARGEPVADATAGVEDYAVAQLEMTGGASARIACSWFLSAGRDAIIEAHFHATDGGVSVRNVDGSFYDFVCERYDGRTASTLSEPRDAWGGRALVDWARRVQAGAGFDREVASVVGVARTVDRIYGRHM